MRFALAPLVLLAFAASPAGAQLVDKPENWGMTLGLDLMTGSYDPSHDRNRGNQEYAFAARGYGLRLSAGAVFLKHFMFGGDIGVALFDGDREFNSSGVTGGYTAQTTNSLMSSLYVGVVTTPIGRTQKMGRKVWLGMLAGKGKWGGERRIEGCFNCDVTPVKMESGAYVEPFVVLGGGDRDGGGGFKLAYRHYLLSHATIRSELSLGLYFNFLKL